MISNMKVDDKRSIVLGEPLDQILNATCKFPFQCDISQGQYIYEGGALIKPSPSDPGTGNIVISGEAGTGKSTLALQILCEAARRNDHLYGAYISLEEEPMQIFKKAKDYGWSVHVHPLNHMLPRENRTTFEDMTENLNTVLNSPKRCFSQGSEESCVYGHKGCMTEHCLFSTYCRALNDNNDEIERRKFTDSPGKVILPQLVPRHFSQDPRDSNQGDALFWTRFHQIENLLKSASGLRDRDGHPETEEKDLRIICIDSLNVLGAGGLTRDHLASLFDLFKRHQTLGIFIVEDNKRGSFAGDTPIDSETIDFLTDMIIKMTTREEEGYWLRHMQVVKSRYQKQALGRHPIKIRGKDDYCEYEEETKDSEDKRRALSGCGIRIFPSVHLLVTASDRVQERETSSNAKESEKSNKTKEPVKFWTSNNLNNLIRFADIRPKDGNMYNKAHVVTVKGPATTGKSLIAGNFLLQGLMSNQDVVLIRLGEHTDFTTNGIWSEESHKGEDDEKWELKNFKELHNNEQKQFRNLLDSLKNYDSQKLQADIKSFQKKDGSNAKGARILIELAVKPGFFLPEVLLAALRLIYRWEMKVRQPKLNEKSNNPFGIDRIVFMEVGQIGVGYPMLRKSSTAAELFLSSFVHVLKCRHTNLLMTAQTGGHEASEEMVKKAISLADQVITCDHCDVFGDRYITVTGPHLIEQNMQNKNTPETVPYVLRIQHGTSGREDYFLIDHEKLAGLVGFSSGHIRRPGVILQVFQEGCLHQKYNTRVKNLVEYAVSSPMNSEQYQVNHSKDEPSVVVRTFDSINSGPFHESLKLLETAPLHNTLLRTIDEFAIHGNQKNALERASLRKRGEEVRVSLIRRAKYEDQLNYGSLYYRNVLLMICDEKTKNQFRDIVNNINHRSIIPHANAITTDMDKLLQLLTESKITSENINTSESEKTNELLHLIIALTEIMKSANALQNRDQHYFANLYETQKQDNAKQQAKPSCIIDRCEEFYKKLNELAAEMHEKSNSKSANATDNKKLAGKLNEIMQNLRKNRTNRNRKRVPIHDARDFWNLIKTSIATDEAKNEKDLSDKSKGCKNEDTPMAFCDRRANETLSCLALDGLLSLVNKMAIEYQEVDLKEVGNKLKTEQEQRTKKYLNDLIEVLERSKPIMKENDPVNPSQPPELNDDLSALLMKTDGNSRFIIFCWYSHLREILHLLHKQHKNGQKQIENVSKNLHVLPLPGGGFTGDWYLDIHPGSVSESLGQNIKDRLLNPQSDFDRFSSGVGLPSAPRETSEFGVFPVLDKETNIDYETWKKAGKRYEKLKNDSIDKHLKAWPNASIDLSIVMQIHQYANRRSKIKGYQKIRSSLFGLMKLHLENFADGTGADTDSLFDSIMNLLNTAKEENDE